LTVIKQAEPGIEGPAIMPKSAYSTAAVLLKEHSFPEASEESRRNHEADSTSSVLVINIGFNSSLTNASILCSWTLEVSSMVEEE
jgi:hypothetical protein